jgi:hypothetical protein
MQGRTNSCAKRFHTRLSERSNPGVPTAERVSIICNERLGADAQARMRDEARILDRLTAIDGVARLSAALTTPTSMAPGALPLGSEQRRAAH